MGAKEFGAAEGYGGVAANEIEFIVRVAEGDGAEGAGCAQEAIAVELNVAPTQTAIWAAGGVEGAGGEEVDDVVLGRVEEKLGGGGGAV